MADTRTTSQDVQAEILDAVRKSQDVMVDAVKRWSDTVQTITPPIPVPSLPYTDKLPRPERLVASAYDFAEQMLAGQRTFAENVLQAAKPLSAGKNGTTAPKARTSAR